MKVSCNKVAGQSPKKLLDHPPTAAVVVSASPEELCSPPRKVSVRVGGGEENYPYFLGVYTLMNWSRQFSEILLTEQLSAVGCAAWLFRSDCWTAGRGRRMVGGQGRVVIFFILTRFVLVSVFDYFFFLFYYEFIFIQILNLLCIFWDGK